MIYFVLVFGSCTVTVFPQNKHCDRLKQFVVVNNNVKKNFFLDFVLSYFDMKDLQIV